MILRSGLDMRGNEIKFAAGERVAALPESNLFAGRVVLLVTPGVAPAPDTGSYYFYNGSSWEPLHGIKELENRVDDIEEVIPNTASTDNPLATVEDATYSDFSGSGTGHSGGLVPDPGATAGTSKYLREDGTWETPPNTTYSDMSGSGSGHAGGLVPDPGATAGTTKYLREDGTWETPPDTTYSDMVGSGSNHAGGLVPDPGATAGTSKYLREDGTWETPPNTTYSDMGASGSGHAAGLVPDPGATAGTSKYLREDGTWETPPDTKYSAMGASGSGHAPGLVPDTPSTSGTSKYLREDGTWETPPDTTYSDMVGSGSNHAGGLVPDPGATAGTSKYLREDGTWETPPNTTYSDMSGSGSGHAGGLVPDPGATAGTSKYLREDGTWETPPDTKYSTMGASGSTHAPGLVPDTPSSEGETKYLREDGTWQVPPDTKYSAMGASGSGHAPGLVPDTPSTSGTSKYLREDGTWEVPPNTTYSDMSGSGSGHAGGLVPDPGATAGTSKYLREDGTWETPPNTTYSAMGASGSGHASGLVPDPGATAGTSKYLREDGTWAVPAGGGSGGTIERYVPKYAHREGNDVYFEAAVDEGASYTFDCGTYTWVGAQMKNAAGTNTRGEIGHTGATTSVTFTAATGETQVVLRFFPGNGVAFEDIDWTKISYTKDGETAGDCSGRNAADIERISGSTILPPKQSTNIIDILEGATQANPVQITLMGDSITNGYSADSGKSWAALLEAYIEDRYPYVTVVNTGVSGWKSGDAVTNIATAMPAGTTVAIAMFGTNNRQTQEHMNALYNDYTTMYNYARNMGAKFIPMCCTAETLVNESITAKYVATMDDVERIISKWAVDHNMEMINLYEGLLKYCNYDSDAFDSLFNQTETTNVGGVVYPFHIHPTNDGHYIMYRLICEALGCNAPVAQYTASVGGGGAPKYLHRIYLYRKGYYYLSFDLFTSSSSSFQGDTQAVFDALAAEFTSQNFTSFSWRSIPQVTGWYRETSDGTTIPICSIYYDTNSGHFVGVREGASLSTLTDATISLSNMEEHSTSPKSAIFDNNIQAIGGGGGGSIEVSSETFPCATGYANFSTNSIVFKNGRVVTLAIILTVNTSTSGHALLGTISSDYRPPSTNVLPGVVTYEDSNRLPLGCTVNVNSDGTVRYYGDTIASGRHICINGSYLI